MCVAVLNLRKHGFCSVLWIHVMPSQCNQQMRFFTFHPSIHLWRANQLFQWTKQISKELCVRRKINGRKVLPITGPREKSYGCELVHTYYAQRKNDFLPHTVRRRVWLDWIPFHQHQPSHRTNQPSMNPLNPCMGNSFPWIQFVQSVVCLHFPFASLHHGICFTDCAIYCRFLGIYFGFYFSNDLLYMIIYQGVRKMKTFYRICRQFSNLCTIYLV